MMISSEKSVAKKLIIVLIIVVFIGLSAARYVQINRKYPNPRVIRFAVGESCTCFDTDMEVLSGTFLTYEELEDERELQSELNEDMKVLKVTVRLRAMADTQVPLFRMAAQNGLMINNPMYSMMLERYGGIRYEMKQGEEAEIELYYSFARTAYYQQDWDAMEHSSWTIELVDTYPDRYIMEIPL